jgi:pyruvate ferredoxin oxidoreductase delta subunit
MAKQPGWKDIPIGGLILEGGTAIKYETGSWRSNRPELDKNKCTNCMLCWVFCPDSAIVVRESKMLGYDLEHCKGCGICARECPVKAITMVEETKFREGSNG